MACTMLTKKNYTLQEEDQFLCNSGSLFHGYGLHLIQEVKGLTKKLYFITVQEEDMQYFTQVHCSHCLHGCGLHYNVLSGLSVKQEEKG